MKNLIENEWIGKRKIRIYLYWREKYYSFYWLQFLKDGSFSYGFQSKELQKMREYGSAITQSGQFVQHTPIIRRGNIKLEDIKKSHITFHPPRVKQKSGIVHIDANKNQRVDEFDLDWFPVKSPQAILYVYSGDIFKLQSADALKGRYEIVKVPANTLYIRMELVLYPIPKKRIQVGDPNAITNIVGLCPHYIVSCRLYSDTLADAGFYILSDSHLSGK